jgi:hypothetical protein
MNSSKIVDCSILYFTSFIKFWSKMYRIEVLKVLEMRSKKLAIELRDAVFWENLQGWKNGYKNLQN